MMGRCDRRWGYGDGIVEEDEMVELFSNFQQNLRSSCKEMIKEAIVEAQKTDIIKEKNGVVDKQ